MFRLLPCLFVISACYILPTADAWSGDSKKPKFTNRLAKETSPYLLMHAHNPTDWYPWGPEAFAKAKKEGKLLFLSIGYSSCYWCHVMERESFNNEAVAKILNDKFVCIKVDREERPDIDHIYMTALTLIQQGSGGWPLSMFLTPEGKPLVGFTYRHPEDRDLDGQKIAGFKSILKTVDEVYREKRKELDKQADTLAEATIAGLERTNLGLSLIKIDKTLVQETLDSLKESFDKQYGGFGAPPKFRGPKFPIPCRLDFVLQQYERTGEKDLLHMVTLTLDQMAQGGIYDQLGGGFHRYTVERTWTVPHFEKMLYDNAQLVEVYSKAYRITKNPLYRSVVEETLAYVQREMMSPAGAFYSSQDAETHHEEGRFYVWTDKEIDEALPDRAEALLGRRIFGADGKSNFEDKYHILTRRVPLAEIAKERKLTETELESRVRAIKTKLFAAREQRDKPFLNKIALTAWSGQMIAGFAEAGRSLKEPKYIETAGRAAGFVLKHQKTPDGRLLRTYGSAPGQPPKAAVNAYQEDYAHLVHGLLTLHEASGQERWLSEARALTDTMIKHHGDDKKGGYYFTAMDGEKLFARNKDLYDGAQPSGNSMAARNLVQLWKSTGEVRYRAEAERAFKTFAAALKMNGPGHCSLAQALDGFIEASERKK